MEPQSIHNGADARVNNIAREALLHLAAGGHLQAVEVLLGRGRPVRGAFLDETPFHVALRPNNPQITKI